VVHTSLQTRAIRTANLALEVLDRLWIRSGRSWRLNERHYGDLQGQGQGGDGRIYGDDQVKVWRAATPRRRRRSRTTPLQPGRRRPVRPLAPEVRPDIECLADVIVADASLLVDGNRPDLAAGRTVPSSQPTGNSLRALVKHLDGNRRRRDHRGQPAPRASPCATSFGDDFPPVEQAHPSTAPR